MEMDKNKDGYISKSELRLAQRKVSLADLNQLMDLVDKDHDGKLTFDEVKQMALKYKESSTSKKWTDFYTNITQFLIFKVL